jgi:hypothetical protein
MEREEHLLEDRLKRAYEDMVLVLEEAIARLLEAQKKVEEDRFNKGVPWVVAPVFSQALEKKVDRVYKRAAFPRGLKLKRDSDGVWVGERYKLKVNRDTAYSLAYKVAGFSPNLVLEMARTLEKTASELLEAVEEARRVALRVGRRCLESPAMKEISRRANLKRMQKM